MHRNGMIREEQRKIIDKLVGRIVPLWRTPACSRTVFSTKGGACYRKRLPCVRGALTYKRQSPTEWH
jgi:hypothetical protein